jgi:hypothetical protein
MLLLYLPLEANANLFSYREIHFALKCFCGRIGNPPARDNIPRHSAEQKRRQENLGVFFALGVFAVIS